MKIESKVQFEVNEDGQIVITIALFVDDKPLGEPKKNAETRARSRRYAEDILARQGSR